MKKTKFIVGISLLVQSVTFVVLFFILAGKKKSFAQAFLALAAVGGVAGGILLLSTIDKSKLPCKCKKLFDLDSCYDADDLENDADENVDVCDIDTDPAEEDDIFGDESKTETEAEA